MGKGRTKVLVIIIVVLFFLDIFMYIVVEEEKNNIKLLLENTKQYNNSIIVVKGGIIDFRISSTLKKGMGYIEKKGYVIPVMNMSTNYSLGDEVYVRGKFVEEGGVIRLYSFEDKKIGKSKIPTSTVVSIEELKGKPQDYSYRVLEIRNMKIEEINITSVLPPVFQQPEHYVYEIKLSGTNLPAYYIGPKLDIDFKKSYNALATILNLGYAYSIRIFRFL